jgi:hypothetical protein
MKFRSVEKRIFKSDALIHKQSRTLRIKGYPSSQNVSIYRKKSSKIPKDFLKNSQRNVAWVSIIRNRKSMQPELLIFATFYCNFLVKTQ